ncbi:MAG: DUF4190 domain-containing protein [Chthoniobacterales bacterium]
MNDLPLQKKTSGLAITSLVLGILSFMCYGFTGIVAVICGHIAWGKIKRSEGAEKGSGMAIAGLVLGYINILILITTIVVLAKSGSLISQYGVMKVVHAPQIQLATKQMAASGVKNNDKSLGYPADAGITTGAELKNRLIEKGFMNAVVAQQINFGDFEIGNVSASDPGDTIFIRFTQESVPDMVYLFTLDGEVKVVSTSDPAASKNPPRNPAYLKP